MGNRLGVDLSGSLIRVAVLLRHQQVCDVSSRNAAAAEQRSCDQRPHCPLICGVSAAPPIERIRAYLAKAPTWGGARSFCFSNGYCVCFVVDWTHALEAAETAVPFLTDDYGRLQNRNIYCDLTGSRAADFERLLRQAPGLADVTFRVHREISCVLEAIDFLVCEAPTAFFRFTKTASALNTSLNPQDKDYAAVPLDFLRGSTSGSKRGAKNNFFVNENRSQSNSASNFDDSNSEKNSSDETTSEDNASNDFYPFLLVNLKGGVSFHVVSGPLQNHRVGGSTIGGGTVVGLLRLLLPSLTSSLDAFCLAQKGDLSRTDMLVGDIYGGGYADIGLSEHVIASTFAKCQYLQSTEFRRSSQAHSMSSLMSSFRSKKKQRSPDLLDGSCDDPLCCCCSKEQWNEFPQFVVPEPATTTASPGATLRDNSPDTADPAATTDVAADSGNPSNSSTQVPSEADVARSILTMSTYNIAQQAYLNCLLHNNKRIVLMGYYLEMPGFLSSVQHCIDFWSQKTIVTIFVRLATNLGAIGAALRARRRGSGAHLTDLISDDRTPTPHRIAFHMNKVFRGTNTKNSADGINF